tara:strand:+ start:184 stop:870 length:687 start_codon:yes stop_codon:yes gene_type:complete
MHKVSCITVTKNRLSLLKTSIKHFNSQTHSNKEMIIVYYNTDKETRNWISDNIDSLNSQNIMPYMFVEDDGLNLGTIRNYAVSKATGEWLCIWDDDDYYREDRISEQLKFCIENNTDACTLKSVLIYSNKMQEVKLSFERFEGWEGSLLCRSESMPKYKNLKKGEDTPVVNFLIENNNLKTMFNPDLYVYIFHDNNISGDRHKEELLDNSLELSVNKIREIKEKIGWL